MLYFREKISEDKIIVKYLPKEEDDNKNFSDNKGEEEDYDSFYKNVTFSDDELLL
ncbi:hypothetical protein Glove_465g51 [Diversispora epigaea]|uniref:Uncharacterized protein n=1 Tax=Diversispora epigaea TaxID=1348612 RepID=A0A397GNF8_9GLOM|nr:hypothetical protein Glove_465g51 [Diversispora epigaea]